MAVARLPLGGQNGGHKAVQNSYCMATAWRLHGGRTAAARRAHGDLRDDRERRAEERSELLHRHVALERAVAHAEPDVVAPFLVVPLAQSPVRRLLEQLDRIDEARHAAVKHAFTGGRERVGSGRWAPARSREAPETRLRAGGAAGACRRTLGGVTGAVLRAGRAGAHAEAQTAEAISTVGAVTWLSISGGARKPRERSGVHVMLRTRPVFSYASWKVYPRENQRMCAWKSRQQ